MERIGATPDPRRPARFLLRRLGLEHHRGRRRRHEDEIRAHVLGVSVVTAAVYAAEFALLQGRIPGTVAA